MIFSGKNLTIHSVAHPHTGDMAPRKDPEKMVSMKFEMPHYRIILCFSYFRHYLQFITYISLFIYFKDEGQLERRMSSSLYSAIHFCFNTVRYAEIYNQRKGNEGKNDNVGHISVIETGGQTTFSGSGEIYENFKKTGLIQNFSGYGHKPVSFFENGFDSALSREIKFNETYYDMHYDVRNSESFKIITTLL